MKNQKELLLEKLKNTYCRLRYSKIHGVGVYAVRDIPKNTNPFQSVKKEKWYKFKMEELKKLDKEVLKMIDDFFVIEKDNTVSIPEYGLNGMDIQFFPNNSDKPNLYTKDDSETFLTLRKIKKGEELTVSYATYDDKWIKK
ncbi:MAG: SET domain-containing protein [Patescibacteria group bacterium]|nr:SET domain-containing protein [Patescibacteria group bacterium]MDD4304724.1 SET domain-containing protein [Patescibacteria group bacterium]MDD4695714.1 SET domain-containing protein [Patescibacteria group bacterium]